MSPEKHIPFSKVLAALLDQDKPFPPSYLRSFSDLEIRDRVELKKIWKQIQPQRRINLLQDLEDLEEVDYTVSFEEIARLALKDDDPEARVIAIRLLWGSISEGLAPALINLLQSDPEVGVRAQAAAGLGYFIYAGELGEISQQTLNACEEALLAAYRQSGSELVRRRALESLGYSSREEISPLIRKAYKKQENEWLNSALVAMGRSANEQWRTNVMVMIDHPRISVQVDAIHAAGELALEEARKPLLERLEEGIEDEEVFLEIVWALSSIGGEGVRHALEKLLEETDDDDIADVIEDALDNLFMTEGLADLGMFEFDGDDNDDPSNPQDNRVEPPDSQLKKKRKRH